MDKAQAEREVRALCSRWIKEGDRGPAPSFSEFFDWLRQNQPACIEFRSTGGPKYALEMWFDQETGQAWKR